MIKFFSYPLLFIALASFMLLSACDKKEAPEVTLYSAQTEHLIRPVLDAFTKKTGIGVKLITTDKGSLITRLEQEGKNTPADVLLIVDIGNIYQAKQKGLLQPVNSTILTENIPENLRGSDNSWFGFTTRARLLFVRKDSDIQSLSYEDLADPEKVKGVLIRSSDNVYNQSLTAAILHHLGAEKTAQWAKGLVDNMARDPQGGDGEQLTALAAGVGNVAVANSYYYAQMIDPTSHEYDQNVFDKIKPLFPNQDDVGAHINIRGGGVTKYAKHAEEAVALLEYLSSPEAQAFFTQTNREFPANPNVEASDLLKTWGDFKKDDIPLEVIGENHIEAIKIMDKAGWK